MPRDPRAPNVLGAAETIAIWPMDAAGACTCGAHGGCNSPGKHPAPHHGVNPNSGYGILTGERNGIFVVDCDVKDGVQGVEVLAQLFAEHHSHMPSTLCVRTGRGGYHFYFKHPGRRVKQSTGKLGKCIDVKGDGGWVVGPGSPHVSGNPYVIVHDAPPADAPDWLLAWEGLYHATEATNAPKVHVETIDPSTDEGQRRVRMFVAECLGQSGNLEPSISGNGGHNKLFAAARQGACYYALPQPLVAQILWECFNPRCQPPWSWSDVERKVSQAVITLEEPSFGPPPDMWGARLARMALLGDADESAPTVRPREFNAGHTYEMEAGGAVLNGKASKASMSELAFRLSNHRSWSGVLYYDAFHDIIRAVNPPIRLDAEHSSEGLSDEDITRIGLWLEIVAGISTRRDALIEVVKVVSRRITVHPVREYLDGLDKNPDLNILENAAEHLWGNTDKFESLLFRKFMVGAVRRILSPGSKMDNMLVLHGFQGYKKTQLVRELFGHEWSSEQMPDIVSKDGSQGLAGVWGQEIGELDKFLKVDAKTAKDYISRCTDRYRPPYGRAFVRRARQTVFIGTTNQDHILRDPTGERRYWVCKVLREIDLEWLREHRDSLWAAALCLAKDQGFEHWISEGTTDAQSLRTRQEAFRDRDAWEEILSDYLHGLEWVSSRDLYRHALARNESGWETRYGNRELGRINACARRLGCLPERRAGQDGWVTPPALRDAKPTAAQKQARMAVGGPLLAVVASAAGPSKP